MPNPTKKQREIAIMMRESCIFFIKLMWGLSPQPVKPEHQETVQKLIEQQNYEAFKVEYFEPFIMGEHITWQQYQILLAVDDAENGRSKRKITIRAGRGVGKSCALAWVIIWYLYVHPRSHVPCTAPGQTQMYDVLWKYIATWVAKLPPGHKEKFDVQGSYVKVTENPKSWFARASTARKENPEALSGLHSTYMLMVIDEASAVATSIIKTGEESLTEENYIMILISNPTRLVGHFYETHKNYKYLQYYRAFQLNAEDSPVVDKASIQEIIDKEGKDSDAYRVSVLGEFPRADAVDDKGYVPLLLENDIKIIEDIANDDFINPMRLGVDPSGEGKDTTEWVVRDNFKAKVFYSEKISNAKSISQKTITIATQLNLSQEDISVDMFGEGAETVKELALAGWDVSSPNVGNKPVEKEDAAIYLNQRACFYMRLKAWIRKGGEVVDDKGWKEELLQIRYRMGLSGKVQIMSKRDMVSAGYKSPNKADALMLTFSGDDGEGMSQRVFTSNVNTKVNAGALNKNSIF